MGTFVEVISPDKDASNIVFGEIKRIEGLLSKYKEDSEIAKLNKLGELSLSPETFFILRKAKEFWRSSGGAFDITVGPLIDLWGFTNNKYNLPQEREVKKALNIIVNTPKKSTTLKNIIKAVAEFYDISEKELLERSRKKK